MRAWACLTCRIRFLRAHRCRHPMPLPRRQRVELCVQEVELFGPMDREDREAAIRRWSRQDDFKDWCRVGHKVRQRLDSPTPLPRRHV